MRTKALICAAAMMVAGVATSQAQVYSVNVAGYVTLALTNGFNLISNPLDLDGTGTNNTLYSSIGTKVAAGTTVYAFFVPTLSYSNSAFVTFPSAKWGGQTNAVNNAMDPGKGVFVKIPSGVLTNITFVGNVRQGALTNLVSNSYQMISSIVPQGGGIQTKLGYSPVATDKVFTWNTAKQTYNSPSAYSTFPPPAKWSPAEPILSVGEAVFLQGHGASKWVRNFTVQ